jgi:DNA-binding GntR family transcriptional regulator
MLKNVVADEIGTPLAGQAYWRIRKAILRGDIAPGARLKIDTLQREFALSSSPLREALSRLTAEGLVCNDERRGFRVAQISAADLQDITAFRLNIEPITLRESMEHGGDEWEGIVVSAFHRLERLEARAPHEQFYYTDEWSDRHKDFHMALISWCPSQRQVSACSMLFDQVERYRRLCIGIRTKPKRDQTGSIATSIAHEFLVAGSHR